MSSLYLYWSLLFNHFPFLEIDTEARYLKLDNAKMYWYLTEVTVILVISLLLTARVTLGTLIPGI